MSDMTQERIKFTDLAVSDEIKRAVAEMGFEEATHIQSQSIPLILAGRDVTGHSQTGTGKTAAFGIPIIEKLTQTKVGTKTRALILCPTRELAIQACEELRKFAKYKHGVSVVPIYGGQHIDRQITSLKKGASIVVGTPGRIMDHMRRRTLKLDNLEMIILDEADEMLNMGFREDIETILKDVPEERQTILFSATMAPDILRIANTYQKDPAQVKIVAKELTVPSIRQYYYEVPSDKKTEALARLLDYYNPNRTLIFCNTKRMVDELTDELQFRGYSPDGLHGDMKQQARDTVMAAFRKGKVDILIATDVAARGIDVDDVDAVFNYDLPQDPENYIHRIGRTGRAGKSGTAYTFVAGRKQIYALKDIERHIKTKVDFKMIPTSTEVNEVRNDKLGKSISTILEEGTHRKFEHVVDKLMESGLTSVEIACAALSMLPDHTGDTAEDKQLDAIIKKQMHTIVNPGKGDKGRWSSGEKAQQKKGFFERTKDKLLEANMTSFILNVGRDDGVNPKHIVGAFTGKDGIPGKAIGKIAVMETHTIVDISSKYSDGAIRAMRGNTIGGKSVNMKLKRAKRKK